jgi:hypothetical protein
MNFQSDQPDKPDRRDRPDEPAFAGRAQWETNSGHHPGEDTSELEGIIGSGARDDSGEQRHIRVVLGKEGDIETGLSL